MDGLRVLVFCARKNFESIEREREREKRLSTVVDAEASQISLRYERSCFIGKERNDRHLCFLRERTLSVYPWLWLRKLHASVFDTNAADDRERERERKD